MQSKQVNMEEADVVDKQTDRERVQAKHKRFKAGQKRAAAVICLSSLCCRMFAVLTLCYRKLWRPNVGEEIRKGLSNTFLVVVIVKQAAVGNKTTKQVSQNQIPQLKLSRTRNSLHWLFWPRGEANQRHRSKIKKKVRKEKGQNKSKSSWPIKCI